MQLLVEKTLEYHRAVDPQAEIVMTDLATQYEALVDSAMALAEQSPASASNQPQSRQLREKDKEIKRL